MLSTRVLRGFGLPVLTLVMGLVAAPNANATTEPPHQCFQLDPYGDTLRIVRIASDYAPGMQGLFVRWRFQTDYQLLGSGVRTDSLTVSGAKDIAFTAVNAATGEVFRFGAHFDPATGSGPFAIYTGSASFAGTLTKIACALPAFGASTDQGEVGLGGPPLLVR